MKKYLLSVFFISWFSVCPLFAQITSQDTLPDNYIPFTLYILNDRLEGASEFLEGFKISMDIPHELLKNGLDIKTLTSFVRNQEITGILTYPNEKTSQI
ncbi:hypothetical protein ACFL6A_04685 [bacterium]